MFDVGGVLIGTWGLDLLLASLSRDWIPRGDEIALNTTVLAVTALTAFITGIVFGLFPAIRKFWLYPAGKLSGGQKQMLAICRAMVEPRRLLLIDEPSKGLAPAIVQNLIAALRELKSTKTTVLLVEQNFAMAKALGDRVAVMDDGRIVHRGGMAELAEDEGLQQRLLGLSLGAHQ